MTFQEMCERLSPLAPNHPEMQALARTAAELVEEFGDQPDVIRERLRGLMTEGNAPESDYVDENRAIVRQRFASLVEALIAEREGLEG